jgi:hypothetical protein
MREKKFLTYYKTLEYMRTVGTENREMEFFIIKVYLFFSVGFFHNQYPDEGDTDLVRVYQRSPSHQFLLIDHDAFTWAKPTESLHSHAANLLKIN